eukprot:gene14805-16343_t
MQGMCESWRKLKDDPEKVKNYQDIADHMNQLKNATFKDARFASLSGKEQEDKANKILALMQQQASALSSFGFECFGIVAKSNTNICKEFGTQQGLKFIENSNTYWEFLSQINGIKEKRKESWENLRQSVQDKLNIAFQESGLGSRVQWKKVKDGRILVEGFPDGIAPAPASTFGMEKLAKILASNVCISFQEVPQQPEEVPEIDESEDLVEEEVENEQDNSLSTAAEAPNNLFPIDCLLGKKIIQKKTHYFVKWIRYDDPTWQPAADIPLPIRQQFNNNRRNDI